ncbi:hypothetical protein GCM10027174_24060 [Salinifilum aidingensis]
MDANDESARPAAASQPRWGRQLALTLTMSAAFLLLAGLLFVGTSAKVANDCLDTGFHIPGRSGVAMTEEGCRVLVNHQRSAPLPDLTSGGVLAALGFAALAALPPYVLAIRVHRRRTRCAE